MKNLKFIGIALLTFTLFSAGLYATGGITLVESSISGAAITGLMFIKTTVISLSKLMYHEYISGPGGAGIPVISTKNDRGAYMHVKQKYSHVEEAAISYGFLRLEHVLGANDSKISFKIYENDGAISTTERRLKRNNAFEIIKGSFYLAKCTPGKNNMVLQQFPCVQTFGQAAADDLQNLYNGYLQFITDSKVVVPGMPMLDFYNVPLTQKSATANKNAIIGNKSGLVDFTPHFGIQGMGTNEISISFPTHANWAGATPVTAGDEHKAILFFRGFEIQNGNKVAPGSSTV